MPAEMARKTSEPGFVAVPFAEVDPLPFRLWIHGVERRCGKQRLARTDANQGNDWFVDEINGG